ncbi:MAG: LysR family transcriptional regulator [Synergistaceae bacterium]|jgi:DNA-binding transcriptional LysR family regulator|nr:LysR family transcriptional regulator [Synergistaceae bacterium]
MDFREIRYLLLLAKTGNISKTAELLRISQPSLSQYLRKTERELGCELFYRGSKGVSPTLAGEEYIRCARGMLAQQMELRQKLNEISNIRRGRLTFGVTTQRGGHLVPSVISAFKQKYPDIELKIKESLSTDDLEEMAIEGDVDIFVSNLPFVHSEISYRLLIDDCLCLVLPPTFSLPCGVSEFSFERVLELIESLRNEHFILPPANMKMGRLIKRLFALLGFEPRVLLESYSADTAQFMVLGGVGITLVQRSVFLDYRMKEKPIYIPIDDPRFCMPLVAGFSDREYVSGVTNVFYEEMSLVLREKTKAYGDEYEFNFQF